MTHDDFRQRRRRPFEDRDQPKIVRLELSKDHVERDSGQPVSPWPEFTRPYIYELEEENPSTPTADSHQRAWKGSGRDNYTRGYSHQTGQNYSNTHDARPRSRTWPLCGIGSQSMYADTGTPSYESASQPRHYRYGNGPLSRAEDAFSDTHYGERRRRSHDNFGRESERAYRQWREEQERESAILSQEPRRGGKNCKERSRARQHEEESSKTDSSKTDSEGEESPTGYRNDNHHEHNPRHATQSPSVAGQHIRHASTREGIDHARGDRLGRSKTHQTERKRSPSDTGRRDKSRRYTNGNDIGDNTKLPAKSYSTASEDTNSHHYGHHRHRRVAEAQTDSTPRQRSENSTAQPSQSYHPIPPPSPPSPPQPPRETERTRLSAAAAAAEQPPHDNTTRRRTNRTTSVNTGHTSRHAGRPVSTSEHAPSSRGDIGARRRRFCGSGGLIDIYVIPLAGATVGAILLHKVLD